MRLTLGTIGTEPIFDLASQKRDARREAGRTVQRECWQRLLREHGDAKRLEGLRYSAALLIRRARSF